MPNENNHTSGEPNVQISTPLTIIPRVPTEDEFIYMAEQVGWQHHFEGAHVSEILKNTRYGALALSDNRVVGMGRVVGDGIIAAHLRDIAVLPQHRLCGIGSALVRALMFQLKNTASTRCRVTLESSIQAAEFYERLGFKPSPNSYSILLSTFGSTDQHK